MSAPGSGGSEWISISDLMSGVVALMVVLFAMSALENAIRAEEVRRAEELRAAEAAARIRAEREARRRGIDSTFSSILADVRSQGISQFVDVDVAGHRVRLREATFARGSACVVPAAESALRSWAPRLRQVLEHYATSELFVEGHTDSLPVSSAGSSRTVHCARFDDNYTLSAARAREARKVLIAEWPVSLQARVALAGFGDSRPLVAADRTSPLNRRVEIEVREPTRSSGAGQVP